MKTLIYNVSVVQRDRVLKNGAVLIKDNKIHKVFERMEKSIGWETDERIDGEGGYLIPGFMDLHSDNIERIAQPRPQSLIDFDIAITEQEKQLICQGITSMYHSLTIMNARETNAVGITGKEKTTLRTPENHKKLVEAIRRHNEGEHMIRHRFHCRYDITNVTGFELLIHFIENKEMQLLSFVDHTPGQGQYRDLQFFKDHVMGVGNTEEEKDEILKKRMNRAKITAKQMEKAADMASEMGIPIASHDDDSIEKLNYVIHNLNANICEFPLDLNVAKEAHRRGLKVVVGATNVLMGRSHSNNLSALDAIKNRCADILVSDYFPASILHAIFKIVDLGLLSFPEAVNLATYNPACAVGVDEVLGSIEEEKLADLLLVQRKSQLPVITAAFVDGNKVLSMSYRNTLEKPVSIYGEEQLCKAN